ncbi:MAG: DUF2834 domain-containing protein [Gammaproteobacteria bacterium]
MTAARKQRFYLSMAIIGVCVTWYFNIQFMIEHQGFSALAFITACYANAASSSIANDLTVVVVTFLFWSWFEARRLNMRNWWLYVVLTFSVAIAFTCPLFLYMRERALLAAGETDA